MAQDGIYLLGQDIVSIIIEGGSRDGNGDFSFFTDYDVKPHLLQVQPQIRRQGTDARPVWSLIVNNVTISHETTGLLQLLQDSVNVQAFRAVAAYKYVRVTWYQGGDPTAYQIVGRISSVQPGGITQQGTNPITLEWDGVDYGQSQTDLSV